jgi:hypothetical protein
MIFSPLLGVFTSQVTAPALIIVGVLMAQNTAHIHWNKLEIAVPAFLIILGMPLTYSISDGLSWGMITYPICMLAAKRGKEVSTMMWVLFVRIHHLLVGTELLTKKNIKKGLSSNFNLALFAYTFSYFSIITKKQSLFQHSIQQKRNIHGAKRSSMKTIYSIIFFIILHITQEILAYSF